MTPTSGPPIRGDAAGPRSGGRAVPGARRSRPPGLHSSLETVAFFFILLLLVMRCDFAPYKIPTRSMEPTLFGDNSERYPHTPGDRILVDRWAYVFRGPARWDVVVFRYPLDATREFIKRVALLPNESGRIERGDVWAGSGAWKNDKPPTLHPARKRRPVREQLYVPVYPPVQPASNAASGSPSDWWPAVEGGPGRWQVERHGRLVYEGDGPDADHAAGLASRTYGFPIRDLDRDDKDPRQSFGDYFLVPDVRVRCRVTADAPAEVELAWSPGDGRRHTLRLASDGRAPSAATTTTSTKPLARALVPGKAVDVELESVDGDLHAWVDGDELAVIRDEIELDEAIRLEGLGEGGALPSLTLSARGGRVVLGDVRVDHDVYYTNYRAESNRPKEGQTLRLGPDDYFVLGDATRHSSDSRKWTANGVSLKDGTKIAWDWQSTWSPVTVHGVPMKEVTDVEGVTRRWAAADEDNVGIDSIPMPFVKRDRMVGRAWLAFTFGRRPGESSSRVRFVH
jgi:signal peptidase I